MPRPPDWILYAAAVLVLALLARREKEHADAPRAPPPAPVSEVALSGSPAFKPSALRRAPPPGAASGTAFSISDAGVWLTARHVVSGCVRAAVMVSPGKGVQAQVFADKASDVAVLTTPGGSAPLPLALGAPLNSGERGYHPGYPRGGPGEAASRLLGRAVLREPARGSSPQHVLAWAEVGRTDGLRGSLAGLAGAPVLDQSGRVVGVTLAESPRRGRIYSTPPEAIATALKLARQKPSGFAQGQSIATDNYGRAADGLRRDMRVAQVVCLARRV